MHLAAQNKKRKKLQEEQPCDASEYYEPLYQQIDALLYSRVKACRCIQ